MRAKIFFSFLWFLASLIIASLLGFRFNKDFYIQKKNGAVGCVSKRYYEQMLSSFRSKHPELARQMIIDHKCFFLKPDEMVEGKKEYCQEGTNLNKLEIYATDRFLFGRVWLPCFVFVEEKQPKGKNGNIDDEFSSLIRLKTDL